VGEVVSLQKWKKEHPKDVVVMVFHGVAVKIMSTDTRTEYAHLDCDRPISNSELWFYIEQFKKKYPNVSVKDVRLHKRKERQ
jgi:hypothetical protein